MKASSRAEAREKGLNRYFTGNPCKHGHIMERHTSSGGCDGCIKRLSKLRYEKNKTAVKAYGVAYRAKNKEAIAERKKIHYKKNKESILSKSKSYHSDNSSTIKKRQKEYRSLHRDKLKASSLEYYKENKESFLSTCKTYREKNKEAQFIRSSLKRLISNWAGSRKEGEKACGYTIGEFRAHLESMFDIGMSWCNHGEWEIDHIKPVSLFIKQGVTDPSVVNSLSNLQPLWKSENRAKGANYQE